jgi:photosystem II stability/assembly factor-like uncharacterized protein
MAVLVVGTKDGAHFLNDLNDPNGERQIELDGRPVGALAKGAGGKGLLAVVDDHAVMSRDEGGHWQALGEIADLQLNTVLPLDGGVLAGTSEAHLVTIEDGAARTLESFETADGRDEWYTPWGGPPDVRSMTMAASGELYVNVHVGGILRSGDGGRSWQPTVDIHTDVHEVRAVDDHPGLVLAAAAVGLMTSTDAGATWSVDTAGLHASYCRAVAVSGDTLLVTASDGPFGKRAAVYRRPLTGTGPFEKCTQGLPEWFPGNIDTACLAATPDLIAFGTEQGDVFVSADAGQTWETAASELPTVRALVIA